MADISSRFAARDGTERRLASALSYILNPIILPPLAFFLVALHVGAGAFEITLVTGTAVLFFAAIPLIYVVYLVRTGRAETLEVRDRTRRRGPLLVTLLSAVAGLVGLTFVSQTGRPLILACAAFFFLNVAIALVVTLEWKISLHMIGMAGFLSTCLFVSLRMWPWSGDSSILVPESLPAALVFLPVLGWARVRSGAHTLPQVIAGGLAGFLLPLIELWLITEVFFRKAFNAG